MSDRFVSACCGGERCAMCGDAAQAKVEEVIFSDDPTKNRHPFTAYVCRSHFDQIMHATPSQAQPVAWRYRHESDGEDEWRYSRAPWGSKDHWICEPLFTSPPHDQVDVFYDVQIGEVLGGNASPHLILVFNTEEDMRKASDVIRALKGTPRASQVGEA